jgi:hypothetical protein
MLKSMSPLVQKVKKEVFAWFGISEPVSYRVVEVSNTMPGYAYPHLTSDLATAIPAALRDKRELCMIFLSHAPEPGAGWYVITIDRVLGRVDRWLSSDEVLYSRDQFFSSQEESQKPEEVKSSRVYKIASISFALLTLPITLLIIPAEQEYRRLRASREQVLERSLGWSSHFATIAVCVGNQLDTETRALFLKSLHALWNHEQLMQSKIVLIDAETLLSQTDVFTVRRDADTEYLEMDDHGPCIESWSWKNRHGDEIASAKVFRDLSSETLGARTARVQVYGSTFHDADAQHLLTCFHHQTIVNRRVHLEASSATQVFA